MYGSHRTKFIAARSVPDFMRNLQKQLFGFGRAAIPYRGVRFVSAPAEVTQKSEPIEEMYPLIRVDRELVKSFSSLQAGKALCGPEYSGEGPD